MSKQTQRGIPVPSSPDPDAVPADMAALAQFLDPGDLVEFDPGAAALAGRIVFLLEGDGEPSAQSLPPTRGSIYLDRLRGRLWLPMSILVDGVSTLGWYRIGTDTDAAIAALAALFAGVMRSPLPLQQVQADTQNLVLTGILAGQTTPSWVATVTFAVPFAVPPVVLVSNGDSVLSPDTVFGVQLVTANDFQVRVSNAAAPFGLNAEVTVAYSATGQ